ncbi:MAG: hypothetical protein WAO20_01640 [Acidobacteriota bacterium]
MDTRRVFLFLVCLAVSFSPAFGQILGGGDGQRKIDEVIEVLGEFMGDDEECIPEALLREAQGIAVFPRVKKDH